MHPGQGPGLSLRDLGEIGGTERVTLLESEMPCHRTCCMGVSIPRRQLGPGTGHERWRRSTGGAVYAHPAALISHGRIRRCRRRAAACRTTTCSRT